MSGSEERFEKFELYKGRMPQLASPLDINKLDKFTNDEYWMEPKLDGFRCIIKVLDDGSVEVLSRTLKPMDGRAPHIEKMVSKLPAGTILDGEIGLVNSFAEDGSVLSFDFTATTNIMRSNAKKAVDRQKEMGFVTLVLFDVLQYDHKPIVDQTNSRRRMVVSAVVDKIHDEFGDKAKKYVVLSSRHEVDLEVINSFLDRGMEGVVIKKADAAYLVGQRRVGTWFKIKMKDNADAVIMGYTEAEKEYTGNHRGTHIHWYDEDRGVKILTSGGKPSKKEFPDISDNLVPVGKYWHYGWIGAIEFGQYKDGVLVKRGQCSGITDELRKELTFNGKEHIGRVIELQHNGADGEGFRHPQFVSFREDKTPEECDWT